MAQHNDLGKKGEEEAIAFLQHKGYTIVASNWREKHLEIDVICTKDNKLAFVEVKSRSNNTITDPLQSVTRAKQKKLIKAAHAFLEQNPNYADFDIQFDVVSIIFTPNKPQIEHIEEAFYPLI